MTGHRSGAVMEHLRTLFGAGTVGGLSDGLWMPKSVEYQSASFPDVPESARGKPMVARKLKVLELRINGVPEGLFAPRAGARVLDLTGPTTPPVDGSPLTTPQ